MVVNPTKLGSSYNPCSLSVVRIYSADMGTARWNNSHRRREDQPGNARVSWWGEPITRWSTRTCYHWQELQWIIVIGLLLASIWMDWWWVHRSSQGLGDTSIDRFQTYTVLKLTFLQTLRSPQSHFKRRIYRYINFGEDCQFNYIVLNICIAFLVNCEGTISKCKEERILFYLNYTSSKALKLQYLVGVSSH